MTLHTPDREHNCASTRCTDPHCTSREQRRKRARRWEEGVPVEHRNYPEATAELGLPDTQLDAFTRDQLDRVEEELVADAIAVSDDRDQAELDDLADQADERAVSVDLQRAFDFKSKYGDGGYVPPHERYLLGRRPGSRRRRNQERVEGDLHDMPDDTLGLLLTFVWLHRNRGVVGDGLLARDQAVQDEWLNRAAGFGIVRKLVAMGNCALPFRYVELARQTGRRSAPRETILRLLMLLDAYGWNGFTISEHQAEDAGICSRAQWWRAVGQLEAWGLLVHVRTYKAGHDADDESGSSGRVVGFCRNWYGIGPRLARIREVYLAELGHGDEDALAKHDAGVERRRRAAAGARWRQRRGVERPEPAAERPRWHSLLVEEVRSAEVFRTGDLAVEAVDALDVDQLAQLGAGLLAGGFVTPGSAGSSNVPADAPLPGDSDEVDPVASELGAVEESCAECGVSVPEPDGPSWVPGLCLGCASVPEVEPVACELAAEGTSSAGAEASSTASSASPIDTALSLREGYTAGLETQLECNAGDAVDDASAPAEDVPSAASSHATGSTASSQSEAPPCSSAEPSAGGRDCSNSGHSHEPMPPEPAGRPGGDHVSRSSASATTPTRTSTQTLLATIDATAFVLAAATRRPPAWSGVRCPECGEADWTAARGGLLRCGGCRREFLLD